MDSLKTFESALKFQPKELGMKGALWEEGEEGNSSKGKTRKGVHF